jgi:hypothetical protein
VQGADAQDLETPGGTERLQAICSHRADTLGQELDHKGAVAGVPHCEARVSPGDIRDSYTLRTRTDPDSLHEPSPQMLSSVVNSTRWNSNCSVSQPSLWKGMMATKYLLWLGIWSFEDSMNLCYQATHLMK